MSSAGNSIACPRCRQTFPHPGGKVTTCPHCSAVVNLSGAAAPPVAPPSAKPQAGGGGILSIPVVCKLCSTRYYAKPVHIGHLLKCPDCHTDNLVVPTPGKREDVPATPTPVASADDNDHDFQLSEPVAVPKYRALTTEGAHLENLLENGGAGTVDPMNRRPASAIDSHPNIKLASAEARPAATTMADMEAPKAAPTVPLHPPDDDRGAWDFTVPKTAGGEIPLAWLKKYPFSLGIVQIFLQQQVLARWITVSLLMAAQLFMLHVAYSHYAGEQAHEQMLGILMFVALAFSIIPSTMALCTLSSAIFENTANGNDFVVNWPEFNLLEWAFTVIYFIAAFCVSGVPGALVGLTLYVYTEIGIAIPLAFIMLSWYFFFPFVFISMQESGSISEPFSVAVLKCVAPLAHRWAAFYFATFALLLVGGPLIALTLFNGVLTAAPAAFLAAAFPVIYFRLLGRLGMIYRDYVHETDLLAEEGS